MKYITSKICGSLSEVYSEMRTEEAKNYQLFKVKEFWVRRKKMETFSKLGFRLNRLLLRWLEVAKATTKEDVINLIGLEKFYEAIPKEYRGLIQDKKPENVMKLLTKLYI